MPKWFSLLTTLALVWLVLAGLLLFSLWHDLPRTSLQWVLLLAFGPPLYIFGEAFFEWLFSLKHGQAISQRKTSPIRILLALPVMLALFALSWWVSWQLTH
jgi:hypothetical protein